jgi:hypothetical protein
MKERRHKTRSEKKREEMEEKTGFAGQ